MKPLLRMLVPAALLAFAPAALAQGHFGPPPGGPAGPDGHGPGGPGEIGHYLMLLHNVNLTTDQQDAVHSLMDAQRTQVGPLLDQMRSAHESFEAKVYSTGSAPSLSDLTSASSQMAQLHAQVEQIELQTLLEVRAVLTPAQVAQIASVHGQLESLRQQTEALLKPTSPSSAP